MKYLETLYYMWCTVHHYPGSVSTIHSMPQSALTGWPSQQGIIELKADWICIVQYSAPSHCVSEQASIHPPLLHVSMAPHHLSTKNITSHNKRLAKTIDKMCYYYQSVSVLLQDEYFILKLSRNWLLLLSAIQIIAKPFSQSSVRFGRGFMPQIWLKHLQKGCKMGACKTFGEGLGRLHW